MDRSSNFFSIKVFSNFKEKICEAQKTLKKNIPDVAFFRMPTLEKSYTVRKTPCGRGFSTFKKYNLKLHKCTFFFKTLKDLKKGIVYVNEVSHTFNEVAIT